MIILVLLFLGGAGSYYYFHKQANQNNVYVNILLLRTWNAPSTTGSYWVPYWIANSLHPGDKQKDIFGNDNVTILDKISYDAPYEGQNVSLSLRIKAVRDRTGVFLYQNKPLVVGAGVDLKFPKVQVGGMVTYIGETPLTDKFKKIIVTIQGIQVQQEVINNIHPGMTSIDDQGRILAKIMDIKTAPSRSSQMSFDSATGRYNILTDDNRKDIQITMELLTKEIDGVNYYANNQRIRLNDILNVAFKDIWFSYPIISYSAS